MSGIVREARRPDGWVAPGPAPAGPGDDPTLWPGPSEDLCYLLGDWRIFQRVDGHRWSLDDLVTAAVAADGPAPGRALDLGCGIGSVLMMTAWAFPSAELVGVEAQAISAALARRSIRYNGCADRVRVVDGDFRETPLDGPFDLVTGTPPYFAPGTHTVSAAVQRGPCRHELRGGVADYVARAAEVLAENGRFVFCVACRQRVDVFDAVAAHGLTVTDWIEVIPRSGKPGLIDVFEARWQGPKPSTPRTLEVRGVDGQWTAAFGRLRARMGLPPRALAGATAR